MAAALIELATAQLNNSNTTTNTGTTTATPSTSNADDDMTVTPKVTPQTPARSRRRGRAA